MGYFRKSLKFNPKVGNGIVSLIAAHCHQPQQPQQPLQPQPQGNLGEIGNSFISPLRIVVVTACLLIFTGAELASSI